ncbi:MAG: DUF6093 family protein [Actinomycetota bacterium]|nr:DUF6093 family protein [Actinomycetota bacterium]
MSNLLDSFELDALREDFFNMLGEFDEGGGGRTRSGSRLIITITRRLSRGTINPTTKLYDDPILSVIYQGPAHISPVTFRRDRQEIGGVESIRIRQYRAILPWDSGDIQIDDVLRIDEGDDPNMIGRTFDITDILYEAEMVVRRISLTDTSKDIDGVP